MLGVGELVASKYRVLRVLGEGGMGVVYEGINERIDRRVAIKVLHASIAREREAVARFEREAQAATRIGSSHIVDVLDLGDLPNGERFIVMEYLDGEALSVRLKRVKTMPGRDAAAIAIQLLDGLAKVHEARIVHRDLKPANVFLARAEGGDFVKLLDFGVCKMLNAGGDVLTSIGQLLGTPSYMAPEQVEHGPAKVDARCDLYSVGVILWRSLSGKLPYRGDNLVELLAHQREGRAPPIAEAAPDVDVNLAKIVDRGIEWDPADRFQSAIEMRQALVDWMAGRGQLDHMLAAFLDLPANPSQPPSPVEAVAPVAPVEMVEAPAPRGGEHDDDASTLRDAPPPQEDAKTRPYPSLDEESGPRRSRDTVKDEKHDDDAKVDDLDDLATPRNPRSA